MTSPKTDKKSEPKSSFDWLSTGFICLLVGGTIAAKMVFLVDDDLEIKTKFGGTSWQLNSQSIKKYATDLERSSSQYLQPLWATTQQQSSHLIEQTSNALASQNLCVSIPKSLDIHSKIDLNPTTSKTERQKSSSKQPATTSDLAAQSWCLK
jgi:hypothetical protein